MKSDRIACTICSQLLSSFGLLISTYIIKNCFRPIAVFGSEWIFILNVLSFSLQ